MDKMKEIEGIIKESDLYVPSIDKETVKKVATVIHEHYEKKQKVVGWPEKGLGKDDYEVSIRDEAIDQCKQAHLQRLEEQQRINNLVLADKCDELDRFAERTEKRLEPLREKITQAYICGYEKGHDDTVESCYGFYEDKAEEYANELLTQGGEDGSG